MQAIANDNSSDGALTIAEPAISDVLAEYLADEQKRLSADSFGLYASVIDLLQDSLNGYAYQSLDKEQTALWEKYYNADGERHREFCEIFGPDEILPNIGEFLGYFMVRKVICGGKLLGASGTVTKKLAKWLTDKGYVNSEDAREAMEHGARAARDLPRADKLSAMLYELTGGGFGADSDGTQDQFMVMRVEPGKLWLQGFGDDRLLGPINLPVEVTELCEIGWSIGGVVRKSGRKYVLAEAWSVYP